jgi:hypothetical protein
MKLYEALARAFVAEGTSADTLTEMHNKVLPRGAAVGIVPVPRVARDSEQQATDYHHDP